jgi:hypothetical protein
VSMNCYSVVAAFGAKKVAFSLHSDKFKQDANVIYSLGLFCLISIRHLYFYTHPRLKAVWQASPSAQVASRFIGTLRERLGLVQ